MSARRVKLSEVVSINPKTDASTFDLQDEVAFIAMADVSEQGQVANVQVRVFDEVKKGYTCFRNGDVLLAKITPCFENGKATQVTGLFSEIGFGSTEFHVLRPSKQINGRFLFHLVWNINFRRLGELRMTGSAGQKRVPAKFLEEYEINLPSFEEQKRIAAILDKADSLRRKRAQAIALADDFLRATFLDMFGDPVTNPKKLPQKPLGELIKLKSGDFLPAQQMASSGEFSVYGGNGINGQHDKFMFLEPRIVIGRVGAYCGTVHITKPKSWVTDNALLVADYSDELDFGYLAFALKFANLNQYASQSGQPLISAGRLNPVMITIPDQHEQRRFSDLKNALEQLGNKLSVDDLEINFLTKSLAVCFLG